MRTNSHPARVSILTSLRFAVRLVMLAVALGHAPAASATTNVTDYFTPTALTPGAPAGSYPLSGFETINVFSGNLNFALPLLHVGGRGTAGYTMMLKSNLRWTIDRDYDAYGAPIFTPIFDWWLQREVGYGPGIMVGRQQLGEQCSLNDPHVSEVYTLTRLTFTSADGTESEFLDQRWHGQPKISRCFTSGQPNPDGISRGKVFATVDGSAMTFVSDEEVKDALYDMGGEFAPTGTLYTPDGTRYRIVNGGVMSITDRNGNSLVFGYNSSGRVITIDDSLNRRITVDYAVNDGQYGVCDQIKYRGFGDAERIIRVARTTLSNTLHPNYQLKTIAQLFGQDFPNSSTSTYNNPVLPSVVWLPGDTPSTTRKYQLLYNSHAELAGVILPTGGAFAYIWNGEVVSGVELYRYVTERRVLPDGNTIESKTTYSRSSSCPVDNIPRYCVDEAQYDKGGVLRAKTKHYYMGSPTASLIPPYQFNYSGWFEGKEYRTDQLDTVGDTPLRSVEHGWQQRAPVDWWRSPTQYGAPLVSNFEPSNDPRINETKTSLLDSGQVAKQTFVYDRYNNKTDVYEHDYGTAGSGVAGPRIRHTHTDYVTTNAVGGTTYDYACDPEAACSWNGLTANVIHLRSLPRVQRGYAVDPQTLAETPVSKIETRYDEADYAPFTYAGVTVPGWVSPATPARGNHTSVRSYLNVNAPVDPDQLCPPGVCVETHVRYDQLGNVRKLWDANGNFTELTYLDAFCNDNGMRCGGTFTPHTYAFATRAEAPGPGAPYGTTSPFVSTAVYDYYTGLVYSTTNANNKVTRYEYADTLDRVTAQVRPDGGRTDFYYSRPDEPYLFVRTLADLEEGREIKSEQHFDKLGRPSRSFAWEAQDESKPWMTVDTFYDALGRVKRTTRSYRSAGPGSTPDEERDGTETTYDAMGRVKLVKTTADGSGVKTEYRGDRVLITDAADRQRVSRTDALGRLTDIWEVTPNDSDKYPGFESMPSTVTTGLVTLTSAYGYHTEYFYDAADKLRRVKQGIQQRFFAYDSLGRLVRARYPEQGTFDADGDFQALSDNTSGENNYQWSEGYLYDANGNMTKRKDARGTVTTYGYDSLNRNVTITYTLGGGTAETADVSRYFDNQTPEMNGLGRLWKTEALHTSRTTVAKYDEAGRPQEQTQQFWVNGNWGQAFTTKLTYNLAGGITSLEYPSHNKVYYQYDTAGRPGDYGGQPAFKGTLGGGAERMYASQMLYDESGGMSQERLGTQTPVYNKLFYNVRGQLAEIRVSTYPATSADPGLKTNWNRGAIINHYSASGWGATGGGPDNNGNLRQQDMFIPKIDGPGYDQGVNFDVIVQHYDYDALNRLKRVEETPGGQTPLVQAYNYDRWGNRTINAGPTTGVPEPQFSVDPLSNRLGVPSGQSGQMNYDAAGNLINDSYSPQSFGDPAGQQTRFYDAEGRMTSAPTAASQTARYTYDADGCRVKRLAGSAAEVWQVCGVGGELLAEYAPNASYTQPQKEYGYRGGKLLVTATAAAAAGWGAAPEFYENPLNPNHPGETPIRAQHITELRQAIDALRAHKNLPGYGWVAPAGAGDPVTTGPITEMRAALDEALGAPAGGYTPGLAQWQPILAAHIQELRQRVLDAWQSEAGEVDIQWLVSDQLGTPRMVLDVTGSLASMSRHDYLPFGDELLAATGGRTTIQGYSPQGSLQSDGVRQQLAGSERDTETALDFMQARYYSGAQGRFTSADPYNVIHEQQYAEDDRKANEILKRYLLQPMRWNRYVYALNNPLRYVDPTGERDEEIVVRMNIVYDKSTISSEEAARKLTASAVADAQKVYATAGIKLEVSYTAGAATGGGVVQDGNKITEGKVEGAVNIFVSKNRAEYTGGVSNYNTGETFINYGSDHSGTPRDPGDDIITHELGHQFGVVSKASWFGSIGDNYNNWTDDSIINDTNDSLRQGKTTELVMPINMMGGLDNSGARASYRQIPTIAVYREHARRFAKK